MAGQETHFNCLIIGAGISGIDAAYHLKKYCPTVKYAILERRGNLGGTWDFFKYPGCYPSIIFYFLNFENKNKVANLFTYHIFQV